MQIDDSLYSVEERGEDETYFMNTPAIRTSGWQMLRQ